MPINEEYIFTYEDYLAMIHQDNLICVSENDVEYKIGKKDRNMPFRMVEYCMELMKEVVKNSNSKFYPIIVPIVLYTGKGKWNVDTNFAERQKTYEGTYEEYKVNIKYTVVDINKIKDIELLEKQDYLANIMLMEKCENVEERMKMFLQIYDNTKDLNQIKMIINYITNLQKDAFSPDVIESLEKIKKEDDSMMSRALECMKREAKENIEKGRREGMASGILKNLTDIIKNMLKYDEDDETIMKYTNAKKEDIDRVRKELKKNYFL